jgi:glycosyltransferase involved in cell wall biosynthesis
MIKVSVILPIFNVAPYLDEAFLSIISQSLKEIEIIAVNDGSTDNSQEIIDRYAKLDKRIIAIHQENQGLSGARNTALSHAQGEYIYMMDSDDILSSENALKDCYDYAKKNQADFIFFDGERFMDEDKQYSSKITRTHLVEENTKYEGKYLLNLMLEEKVHNSVVWLLLINRHFLNLSKLTFYPNIIHEDELFTTILTLKSSSIYCLKKSLIKHRIRPTSIMGRHYSKRNLDCYLTIFDELFKFQNSDIIRKFARYTLSKVFYTGHIIPTKDKFSVFWRAIKSGYLKYIGIKSSLVFWLK